MKTQKKTKVLIGPSSFAATDQAPLDLLLENGFEVFEITQQILEVDPDTATQGDFTTVTITCSGTYFTQETPGVSMSYHDDPQQTINAISVEVMNDSVVEASFGFPFSTPADHIAADGYSRQRRSI